MKNITNNHGKYRILKYFDKKYHDFGSYPTEEIAVYVRDLLQGNDWKIPFQSTTIFELNGKYHVIVNTNRDNNSKANLKYVGEVSTFEEARQLANNPLGEKYLNRISGGYNISKTVNKQNVSFAYFKEHKVAYDMRDYLISCEWELPKHNKEYLIHINNTNYLIRVENGRIKIIDDDDLQNIYKTKERYSISRLVGKERQNYKTYPSLEEAISMRNFLREHNWDSESFKEEYNKRYPPLPAHIYLHDGKYVVRKFWKGMQKTYGRYNTLQEAENRVQYLEKHNWQTGRNISIVNYDGTFLITKNVTTGFVTPFRNFYYASENRDEAEEMLERFKVEGFPEPCIVTNKYRYIIRNRQVYYVMYHKQKLCYTRSLSEAFVARDLCEWLGRVPLVPGGYVYDDVEYDVSLNSWGTPFFKKR